MKILFLDHDEVLCFYSEQDSRFKSGKLFDNFNYKAIKVLNSILLETDAEIVVTSDWRENRTLEEMQNHYLDSGIIKAPIDFTPIDRILDEDGNLIKTHDRVKEIQTWLKNNEEKVTKWVAIDDLPLHELDNFVHCTRKFEGIKQIGIKDKILKFLV